MATTGIIGAPQDPRTNPQFFTTVLGAESDPERIGVVGVNSAGASFGFLAGKDPAVNGATGVYGESVQNGVVGRTASGDHHDSGVLGLNNGVGQGVKGFNFSTNSLGLLAGRDPLFNGATGVYGESPQNGVFGRTTSKVREDHAVYGQNDGAGHGVTGVNTTANAFGFLGGRDPFFNGNVGVYGESGQNGVFGRTASSVPADNAVYGQNDGAGNGVAGFSNTGVGIFGASATGLAAKFKGNVEVTGDIRLTNGEDCAEEFDVPGAQEIDAGTVMVINQNGGLQQSEHEYDRKVAGVVSGAGDYRPGIVLGKREASGERLAIALLGKVYCKVDARFSPIEVGDLLTTSPTQGHAMKAINPAQALGALIGKALRPLQDGQGLIPILVALQ